MMYVLKLAMEPACHIISPIIASFIADCGINDILSDIFLSSPSASTLKNRMHEIAADTIMLKN